LFKQSPNPPDHGHFKPKWPKWPSICSSTGVHTQIHEFKHLDSFKFSDLTAERGDLWSAFGTIHVIPGLKDQEADLKINMTSASSELEIVELISSARSTGSLAFQVPFESINTNQIETIPCLGADIVLSFRPGLVLENFQISSPNLELFISSSMIVKNTTEISLNTGGLSAHPFVSSRKTYINGGSNSISGDYGLYDLLSIRSQSGSVSIGVEPKEADKEEPKPAVLTVHSGSGSIRVQTSQMNIPEREYRTTVIAQDGTISGSYLHGTLTDIESASASIDVDILPYSADGYASTLLTKSASGSQKVNLLSPYTDTGKAIARLKSTHVVASGQLQLAYPDAWEGQIEGRTSSGSLTLQGRDVDIIEQGSKNGGKYVVAKKGDGASSMKFDTQSGSVQASIGY
jgi:hypothetical protein